MTILGLTGSFGTGKTLVASLFKRLGAEIIDADRIAHDVIKKNSSAYKKIIIVFGKGVLAKNGNIDRSKLAAIVFGNRKELRKLNRIVHPEVIRKIKEDMRKLGDAKAVVIDAPLLVEAKVTGMVDKLVVVKASRTNQVDRCVKKFKMKKEDVLRRIENEIPLKTKIVMADFVVSNDGRKSETKKQVEEIWRRLWR